LNWIVLIFDPPENVIIVVFATPNIAVLLGTVWGVQFVAVFQSALGATGGVHVASWA
jgi:hypothetical protein